MNPQDRRNSIRRRLTDGACDVLVIGGGIVGAGVARDAAMRGLRVGLVEMNDFASGTSSRSSRLLHGGIRYLAQGRIGLVREASLEKRIIHRIAPHLAQPLPFVFPAYRDNPHWKLWQLKIGVKLYDLLCGGRNLGGSSWLNPSQLFKRAPGLRDQSLIGGVRYFDGMTNDARLTLDTLRSAAVHQAAILNYCRFVTAERSERWTCFLEDRLNGEQFQIIARSIVNASGPWADGLPHSRVKLRLTKGIHLVIDRSRLPVGDAVVMSEGRRILFVIPWGERIVLGTTDTDYHGSLDHIAADAQDIRYVLNVTGHFFPHSRLAESDVISAWAGVRPLIAAPGGKPSDISRSHEILSPEPNWWDVAGGKLTTYRLMAEQTVDRLIGGLKRDHPAASKWTTCRTAEEPLLAADEAAAVSGITPPPFEREAVAHYCQAEWAVHLEDVMIRRTSWHYYHRDAQSKSNQVARWMSEVLGWSEARRQQELDRYRAATAQSAPSSISEANA